MLVAQALALWRGECLGFFVCGWVIPLFRFTKFGCVEFDMCYMP